jgi:serine/threonine protein kinase
MKLLELKEKIGEAGLDLLWHLLDLNPATRISAEKALQHEFFRSIRNNVNEESIVKYDFNMVSHVDNYSG